MFGEKWREDLDAIISCGATLEDLVREAEVGGPEHFAKFIREGMERGRPKENE